MTNISQNRSNLLFILLGGFFIANALIAEFIGVKIFSLEKTLGMAPVDWTILSYDKLSFNLTVGVLLWPVVFIMTDVINEYYGIRGVRLLSWLAVGLISYAFLMVFIGIRLPAADFWLWKPTDEGQVNMDQAFDHIFGQGLWIIIGSLIAFLIGQLVDVMVFHKVKRWTGESRVWLRATGSTLISQLIDSFVVLYIAFYIGGDWELKFVLAICVVNYVYKFTMAVILTPLIYLAHYVIDKFLGEALANELKVAAMNSSR